MNRRLSHPLAPVESRDQALDMTRYSVMGFGLWAVVLLGQGALVWGGFGSEPEEFRAATTGFAVLSAILATVVAAVQWSKPNRILPVFGLAWSLYELSSLSVGLMVGMPMAMGGLPTWAGALSVVAMLVCAVLHVGGLRGSAALSRF